MLLPRGLSQHRVSPHVSRFLQLPQARPRTVLSRSGTTRKRDRVGGLRPQLFQGTTRMKRKQFLAIVCCALALLLGWIASESYGCDKCATKTPTIAVTVDELTMLDQLVAAQLKLVKGAKPADLTAASQLYEELVGLQARMRDCDNRKPVAADVTLLATILAERKGKLKSAKDADLALFGTLKAFHLRIVDCVAKTKSGVPSTTCCSTKKTCCGKCGTPACTCGGKDPCCCEPKTVNQYYIVDNAEFAGDVDGIDVATCQGPIRVGAVHVYGRGSQATGYAAVLTERAMDKRSQDLAAAIGAMNNCAIRSEPCYGIRSTYNPCYSGPRPMVYLNRGGIGLPVRSASYSSASSTLAIPYAIPPARGHFCDCQLHIATCRQLYGPGADWRRIPCCCARSGQPCPQCAACGH